MRKQVFVTNGEQLSGGSGPSHSVKKSPGRIDGLADEVEVFLHFVYVSQLGDALVPRAGEEIGDVGVNVA
ncbi:MAG: hypothetical protein RIQ79_328 [Verrucomicrobiota bacterium]